MSRRASKYTQAYDSKEIVSHLVEASIDVLKPHKGKQLIIWET